jgi:hypothetical protein
MANDEDFLGQFPPGSIEREYHGTLLGLINEIDFPRSEEVGLALLRFFQVADFTVGSVDTTIHPAAGSVYENAELVAWLFHTVDSDSVFWIASYQSAGGVVNPHWFQFWVDQLRSHPKVSLLRV